MTVKEINDKYKEINGFDYNNGIIIDKVDKDEVIAITKRIKIKINELKYELKCVYKKVRKEELKELKKEKSLVKDKKTSKH